MKISIIAALDENNGIGFQGRLPWYHPEDLKLFRETTKGAVVIMGRRTWDSVHFLKERVNVVVSRTWSAQGTDEILDNRWGGKLDIAHIKPSLKDAIAFAKTTKKPIYIIGGAEIYSTALPLADEVVLTRVPGTHTVDTYFPRLPLYYKRHKGHIISDRGLYVEYFARDRLAYERSKLARVLWEMRRTLKDPFVQKSYYASQTVQSLINTARQP